VIEVIGLVILGLAAGILAASLGIGGGIVFVPVLVSVFAFSQLDAQGTSLAVIVPTTVIATYRHAKAGRVVWRVVAITGTAGILGALAGSQVAYSLDEEVLQRIFAVVLILLAIRMGRRAWTLRPAVAASVETD
jgi:uncharacterized membrane protein YfcA